MSFRLSDTVWSTLRMSLVSCSRRVCVQNAAVEPVASSPSSTTQVVDGRATISPTATSSPSHASAVASAPPQQGQQVDKQAALKPVPPPGAKKSVTAPGKAPVAQSRKQTPSQPSAVHAPRVATAGSKPRQAAGAPLASSSPSPSSPVPASAPPAGSADGALSRAEAQQRARERIRYVRSEQAKKKEADEQAALQVGCCLLPCLLVCGVSLVSACRLWRRLPMSRVRVPLCACPV